MTGTVGYLLGLPLDIRHVTFSTANLATALVGLGYQVPLEVVANALAGVFLIGAVNLLVSFGLALWVAMRARKVRFKRGILLVQALGRQLLASPIDFLLGPKQQPISREPGAELLMRDTK